MPNEEKGKIRPGHPSFHHDGRTIRARIRFFPKTAKTTRHAKRKKEPQETVELSDQQELVDIRKKLGLRHQDYAIMLESVFPDYRHTLMDEPHRSRQTSCKPPGSCWLKTVRNPGY